MMGWEMNADNTAASSSWGGGNTDTAEGQDFTYKVTERHSLLT